MDQIKQTLKKTPKSLSRKSHSRSPRHETEVLNALTTDCTPRSSPPPHAGDNAAVKLWFFPQWFVQMAFRGRGRGRGGFGNRGGGFAKEEKYEVFPEIKEYPDVNLKQKEEFRRLISWGDSLEKFWISSPYHLGASGKDSERNGGIRKASLSDYMKMTDDYVPAELVARNVRHNNKKIRWDPQSDLQRLDLFEKLDKGPQGQDDGEKEKKEDEDDDEDNENIEEEEEDSGDDYDQNPDFDDDEDDFNMNDDGGGDEGYY
ncbi:hypothetical protein L1987_66127 [Smallanthus sonchifolius]|uniref:Uncharacterized protein n=1 Tax=Smallanthus sonchifolius TaxID=185202 RepID=A0ACB9BWF7_9ASTR|nr:hypothetical protein L1987_66127 [Smallanthus sonchifolius]